MQLEPALLRHHLVYLTSLPDEMLGDEFNELMSRFMENQRDEAMIREHSEREWGSTVLESDSQDLPF